jgi:DNA-binding response OmpR family regulator
MNHILVVEDEPRIASALAQGLQANGYTVTVARDGMAGRAWLVTTKFALVILDLRLPELDGIDVLRDLRRRDTWTPVIVLTVRDTVHDKVRCFEAGADDYLTKPFRFDELLARIRARLRPTGGSQETALTVGMASLDLLGRRLVVGGRSALLTAREFALAEIFFRNVGRVLSREQLLDHVWGFAHDPRSNIVDVHVGYLRRKLGVERITTVRGMGYRLEPDRD